MKLNSIKEKTVVNYAKKTGCFLTNDGFVSVPNFTKIFTFGLTFCLFQVENMALLEVMISYWLKLELLCTSMDR